MGEALQPSSLALHWQASPPVTRLDSSAAMTPAYEGCDHRQRADWCRDCHLHLTAQAFRTAHISIGIIKRAYMSC